MVRQADLVHEAVAQLTVGAGDEGRAVLLALDRPRVAAQESGDPRPEPRDLLGSVQIAPDAVGDQRRAVGVEAAVEAHRPHLGQLPGEAQRDVELLADPRLAEAPQLTHLDDGLLASGQDRLMVRLRSVGEIAFAPSMELDPPRPAPGRRPVLGDHLVPPAAQQVVVGE